MNSVHDMGGMQGFGPIIAEKNEPVFHAPWEGRVLAMNIAMATWGKWNIDRRRYVRELIPPAEAAKPPPGARQPRTGPLKLTPTVTLT